ncbi:hypothetical protein EJ07DRAFT_176158 [Lizonia empirigonia]|nr:hypothetical protein EJ07DRAFT_176158 [Lizonia empirigonia]
MVDEPGSPDDLYCYNGRHKLKVEANIEPDNFDTQTRQPRQDSGIDFSTFADAIHYDIDTTSFLELSRTNSEVITDLRNWLSGFELPRAYADQGQDYVPEINSPHRVIRKRAFTTQALLQDFPFRTSAEHRDQLVEADTVASVDPYFNEKIQDEPLSSEPTHLENDEPEVTVAEERSVSPLYEIMPLSPIEGTLEWIERQRVREEYNAIERARAYRLELESHTADVREASLKMAGVWDKELREWGQKCQRAKMAKNLALFDASRGSNGATATFGEVDPQSPVEESNDIEVELDLRDYTISVAETMMYKDTNMYMLPRPWNMGDRPRRTRLYENIEYLEQYLKQEAIIIPLVEERLDYLHEGRSEQPEHAVVVEIRGLEKQLAVHSNGESNNERLVHDHLRYAADWMLVDMETGSQETRAFDGRALTDSFSPFMVKFIRSFPRLKRRFRLIRDVEKFYFPDRFKASSQHQLHAQPFSTEYSTATRPVFKYKRFRVPARTRRQSPDYAQGSADTTAIIQAEGTKVTGITQKQGKRDPPRQWLSSAQIKRHRALNEPVTPENIENLVERNRAKDLYELRQRHRFISNQVFMNYVGVLDQLRDRYPDLNHRSSQSTTGGEDINITEEADSRGRTLRVVNVEPFERSDQAESVTSVEGNLYTETLEDDETFFHVVNVNHSEKTGGHDDIDSAHSIGSIEGMETDGNFEEARQLRGPQPETVEGHTSSLAQRIIEREVEVTVTEIEGHDSEDDESFKPKKRRKHTPRY